MCSVLSFKVDLGQGARYLANIYGVILTLWMCVMDSSIFIRPWRAVTVAIVAIIIGVFGIFSGVRTLLGSAAAQAAVGDAVP